MGFGETNMPPEARLNHTEMRTKPRDFTRPASPQRQDTTEKLQLASVSTPEEPRLLRGMPRGDQASTSGSSRSERAIANYLVKMIANEHVRYDEKKEIIKQLVSLKDKEVAKDLVQLLSHQQLYWIEQEKIILLAIRLKATELVNDFVRLIPNDQININVRYTTLINAIELLGDKTTIPSLEDMHSNQHIDHKMLNCIDKVIAKLKDVPEASSPHSAGESRSPERREGVRSGEGSSTQGGQLIDQMKKILEEHSQMKERENKLKQEAQKLRQEYDRFQRQLTDAREERDQARNELRGARQELDQARRQLREERQEHNRTQEQLTKAQQDLNRTQEQLTKAQQERDQTQTRLRNAQHERDQAQLERDRAHLERDQAQLELRQLRTQEEQRRQRWDSLYDILMNAPGQPARQDERGQSSRGDLRVNNDAFPTTREGIEGQLGREQRTQQESRERVQQLRERIQRTIWEQGNRPLDERLNELLKYPIEGVLKDHHLVEEIYPPNDQPEQDRQALRQSLTKALRYRLRNLYLTTLAEYAPSGLGANDIAGEFVDQLGEQMREHNRPNQEWIDASEDIQEEVTGSRPRR